MTIETASVVEIRRRLEEERSDIARGARLAAGLLRLLSDVQTAIAAMDAVQFEPANFTRARIKVRDVDGEPLALGIFQQDGTAVAVEVATVRALAIAQDLIAAAHRRLAQTT